MMLSKQELTVKVTLMPGWEYCIDETMQSYGQMIVCNDVKIVIVQYERNSEKVYSFVRNKQLAVQPTVRSAIALINSYLSKIAHDAERTANEFGIATFHPSD